MISIFDILSLLCGLALFLYGMEVMGDSLKKSAGSSLKTLLGKMTSSPLKGFLLGLGVTAVIQSSSATTVMVVGFVNSGTMTLLQSVGVIMGANVGTAVTSWLTAMSGIGGSGAGEVVDALKFLKPSSWLPLVALAGICLLMFTKRGKKRDIGCILLGFAVLMTGMDIMSESMSVLNTSEEFRSILTMFENPILGVMAGLILTAIVQSSSASVGILQTMTTTGAITYGAAIPIVMGQNIGTCVTALISSIGAGRNGKRAALIHLYFNIIGVTVVLSGFYLLNWIFSFAFVGSTIDMWGVAVVHTVFKIISVALISPFYRYLEKLARLTIKDSPDEKESQNLLDERLLETPAFAVARATEVTGAMAEIACGAFRSSLALLDAYDVKEADKIRDLESKADTYEDTLGSYLVKLSSYELGERDSAQITKLLHIIGDFERISDHAVNLVESAEEMKGKKLSFSPQAQQELSVLRSAVEEILRMTEEAFLRNDVALAREIEPLEQVVDDLKDQIKLGHVLRLQKSECTIEHGFILADMLNDLERVSDHCSNIASCVIEISAFEALDMHKYLYDIKHGSPEFEEKYQQYKQKYTLAAPKEA